MYNLSKGSLKKILDGVNVTDPVLHIMQIKNIQNNNVDAMTRYKITLFDGESQHTFGILATQKNYLIENNELKVGSVIKLSEYAANVLSKEPQKVVIILMNFEILGDMDINRSSSNDEAETKKVNNENQEPNKVQAKQMSPPSKPPVASNNGIGSKSFFKQENLKQPNKPPPQPSSTTTQSSTASAASGSFNGFKIFNISSLNPYQNKWSLKVRVTNKTPIRTWSNAKGEGKVFSVDFIDGSGEIKASVFNDACDKYYDMLQIDHCYYVSKAQLKTANKQYSTIDNDYEMSFGNDTLVESCEDEPDSSIPHISLNLIPLSELLNKNANDIVDVIGIVKSVSDVTTIVAKQTNKELKKREIFLVDNSNCSVSVTLWGKTAEDFEANDNPVIALKGVKVSEYNGRTLGAMQSTCIQINPDIPEAHSLRGWYDQGGHQMTNIQDISTNLNGTMLGGGGSTQANFKTLDKVADDKMGMGDKADYFSSNGVILFAKKDNSMYMACPSENCNKKVVDQNNGQYRCEKCNKEFDTFKWRMILSLNIGDHSDSQWVTCFQETSEAILGIKAQDLGDLKTSNSTSYEEFFSSCLFKEFNFKLRAKMETYNDERRVKITVANVEPIDYISASKRLLQSVKQYADNN